MDIKKLLNTKKIKVSILDSSSVDSEFVIAYRKRNNLQRIELANILGITANTIEGWEMGRHKVNGSSKMLLDY